MIAELHVPGRSLLHRAPAGAKLAGLALLGVGLFPLTAPGTLVALAAALALAYPACGLGWGRVVAQIRGLALFLGLIAASQAWIAGWAEAIAVTARVLALVLAAALVTYTTPLSALLDTLEQLAAPLARLGVPPTGLAFALGLAIRFIPVMLTLVEDSREALAARGRDRALTALALPLILRTLLLAEQVAEAVDARGLDSPTSPRS